MSRQKAESRLTKAQDAERALKNERDAKRRELLDVEAKRINAELSKEYDERLEALAKERSAAYQAYEETLIDDAEKNAPYQPGTKLFGWGQKKSHGWRNNNPVEIQAQGIFEIVKSGFQKPDNVEYGPSVGTYVVRFLKKDGTPSKQFQELGHWRSWEWLPEGKKPKAAE